MAYKLYFTPTLAIFVILLASVASIDFQVPDANMHKVYSSLYSTSRGDHDLVVLFYSPMCQHCEKFIGKYEEAFRTIKSNKNIKLDFLKANCGKYYNMIAAFDVDVFPDIVYFHKGVPRERMPLMLTKLEGLTEQWFEMMFKKYNKNKAEKPQKQSFLKAPTLKQKQQAKPLTSPSLKKYSLTNTIMGAAQSSSEELSTEVVSKYHHNMRTLLFSKNDLFRRKSTLKVLAQSFGSTAQNSSPVHLDSRENIYEPTEELGKLMNSGRLHLLDK